MKKVLLLFPPEWVPTAPYLALPSLTAVLRQNGVEVAQKDINVEMYDHFFSREFLCFAEQRIRGRLKELREKQRMGTITPEEKEIKEILQSYTHIDLEHHIRKVERGKEILRSQEFYEVEKAEWALNAFREVMELISVSYFPAHIHFYPAESNLNIYQPWISEHLVKAPHDDRVNIYADICRRLVFKHIEEERPDVIGISIGTPVQLMSGVTFATLIKEKYPHIHVTVGGNVVTRLKDRLPEKEALLGRAFDSMISYEGEHAMVALVEAIDGRRPMSEVPNLIYRDEAGQVHVNALHQERVSELPPPDFDGLPWELYFSPEKLVPYLGTRGCYWGKCTFCDHGAGYIDQFRAKHASQIVEELKHLRDKYDARHFLFTDESFPPALFVKLPPLMVEAKLDIYWTTLIRFEASLLDPAVWDLAAESGCRSLYFGLESANERIIKLVKKDTRIDAAIKNLSEAKRVGIWSHVMAFYGFPGETEEEAEDTRRFLLDHRDLIHSVEMYFFVLYGTAPIMKEPEKYGITVYKNPEHDLAFDHYYTPESGLTTEQAMEKYQAFYHDDFDPWAMRINAREHVFLYITHYGTNNLPDIYHKNSEVPYQEPAPGVML